MSRPIAGRIDGALDHATGMRRLARAMREVPEMTGRVVGIARGAGWLVHHSRAAVDRSGKWSTPMQGHPGFPDLALVHERHPVAVMAELKRWGYGSKSLPDRNQDRRLRAYGAVPGIYAVCWDTLDLVSGTIAEVLADPARVVQLAALPYEPKGPTTP